MFNPLLVFLVIFVGAPLIELYVLIEVGGEIGALPTIALSIFTALLGGHACHVHSEAFFVFPDYLSFEYPDGVSRSHL